MFEDNSCKAYAEIWGIYNKAMKAKLEDRKNIENEHYNNTIKLLDTIKEHTLIYEESKYSMSIIYNTLVAFLSCKQK